MRIKKIRHKNATDLVVSYLIRLKNSKVTSISEYSLLNYLDSVGLKNPQGEIKSMVTTKTLLKLKNGKVSLNLRKLKKG